MAGLLASLSRCCPLLSKLTYNLFIPNNGYLEAA